MPWADVPETELNEWLHASNIDPHDRDIDRLLVNALLPDFCDAQALHNGHLPADRVTRTALHVTSAGALPSILATGLKPQIGSLSRKIESVDAVYLFPTWADMEGANWLFDNWNRRTELVLLAVNLRGLRLDEEASYEIISYAPVEPWRISVLANSEIAWSNQKRRFIEMGGRAQQRART